MAIVPVSLAQWLRDGALFATVEDAAIKAAWSEIAVESEINSVFAFADDAEAEATREIAFLGQPLALETVRVKGRQQSLVGTARKIECDRAGYAAAPRVFILAADERDGGVTELTVLRRMNGEI